jgi:hypothetical protein
MIDREEYTPNTASAAQLCRLWSSHVDDLECHLSANTWALTTVSVVLIACPIVRILIPAILHHLVPDVVRTMLNMM